MSVFSLGLNHHTAPLDLRGRLAFTPEQLAPTLHSFRQAIAPAGEVALVSTCNRTELYLGLPGVAASTLFAKAAQWLSELRGVPGHTLREHAFLLEGPAAARHAFRVASGLDSMVLGEPQILGQMKQAVREAEQAGTLGTTLHQMFQRSFAVAKEVRSSTAIGAHSISMAAASVRLASQLFGQWDHLHVLFVGAGEMIELAATHFAAKNPKSLAVANRTLERGEKLASRLGAQCMRLAELPSRLHEFDVVVSCTASSVPIIGLGAVERALKQRKRRPIFMVDLAVPRDVEPEVARLPDVYLYTVDDLSALVQTASEKRQAAVAQAEAIIETGVKGFAHWLDQRQAVPLIQALHSQAEQWRQGELARARKLMHRGEPIEAVLDALARGLTQKMLHGALAELHGAEGEQRAQLSEAVSRIFLRGALATNAPDTERDEGEAGEIIAPQHAGHTQSGL
jgi:glutamyl-tRNA reductase